MVHKVRIGIGASLLTAGVITMNPWFLLGIFPLVVGLTKFCPLCFFAGKCSIKGK